MNIQLPVLPETWSTTRVDRVASVNARIGWKALTADEYQTDGYAFLSTPNIKTKKIDFKNVNFITKERYEESPELKLQKGDVLLAKDGNTLGIVNIIRSLPRSATVNGSIAVIRPFGIDPAFLQHLLESRLIQATINLLKGGMGVPHLFQWDIKRLPVPLPPREEQRRIADFLDTETARIDRHVSLQRQLRSTLQEKLDASMDAILLRGFEHRPIEPSNQGSPFPTSFKIGRLKNVATRIDVGIAEAATHAYASTGVPLLRSTNIKRNGLETEDLLYIEPIFAERNRTKYVNAGDILTVRTGNAGVSAVVPPSFDRSQTFTQLITSLSPGNSPEYYCHFLNSSICRQYFDAVSWGSAQKNISVPLLAGTPVPIPHSDVQRAIAAEVERIQEQISTLATKLDRSIDLVQERRQALITAAVTGQFDVSTASGRGVTE
ncbi:restriction endonuclease subunit S [Actinomadura chokoriensis]|uniref:restriction endonuclease subunit S n=1 Tax=Actinomadura chokoriensis TaxID=454156 RepID=UPI0031F8F542